MGTYVRDADAERVLLVDAAGNPLLSSGGTPLVGNSLYNGTAWVSQRGNLEGTLLASAARVGITASPNQTNHNSKGVVLWLNITAIGTGNLALALESINPVTALPTRVATSATRTTTGTWALAVYPGASVVDNGETESKPGVLPPTWRARVFPSDGSTWTYSVGYGLVV